MFIGFSQNYRKILAKAQKLRCTCIP